MYDVILWRAQCLMYDSGPQRNPRDRRSIASIMFQFILWQSNFPERAHVINISQFIAVNLGSEQWRNGYKLVIIIWGQTQRCGTVCRGRHLLLSCEDFLKTFPQTSAEALIPRLTLIHKQIITLDPSFIIKTMRNKPMRSALRKTVRLWEMYLIILECCFWILIMWGGVNEKLR